MVKKQKRMGKKHAKTQKCINCAKHSVLQVAIILTTTTKKLNVCYLTQRGTDKDGCGRGVLIDVGDHRQRELGDHQKYDCKMKARTSLSTS